MGVVCREVFSAHTIAMKNFTPNYFRHHFLIAMPQLEDLIFAQCLVYLIDHDKSGATGLVINQPSGFSLADIIKQLNPTDSVAPRCYTHAIYTGGPLQNGRSFVLHSPEQHYKTTLPLGDLSLTTSQDILFALAEGVGPQDSLITLGFAAWSSGQLEQELIDNVWLTCPANNDILFRCPHPKRLAAAASTLGIELNRLSYIAGHA